MADLDFQPLDFQPDSNPKTSDNSGQPSGNSGQLDFKPLDFQPSSEGGSAPSGQVGNSHTPDMLGESDFQRIGKKYGVDPSELRSVAPYYGAQVGPKSLGEAVEVGAKGAAGFAGRSLGFNIPQKIYSKLQSPQMRQALDELQGIGNEQQSPIETASEMVANPLLPGGSTAGRRIAATAAIGAAQGVGTSKEGEEVKGAVHGAAFGAALGTGGEILGKLLSRGSKLAPEEIQAIRSNRIDLARDIDEISQKTQQSEDLLNDIVLGEKDTITRPEVNSLVEEQIPEDSLSRMLDPSSSEGRLLRKRADAVDEGSLRAQLANDIVENRARDFAGDLSGKRPESFEDASDIIQKFSARQGEEALGNKYKDFLQGNMADRAITEKGLVATDQPGFFGQTANKLSDNQYVLRHLDDKYGTRSEDALRELNKANNRYTFIRKDTRSALDDIFQDAKKLGVDQAVTDTPKIYDALNTGKLEGLTPQEQEIASRFKNEFDRLRDFANGVVKTKDPNIAPLNIPKVENYVPHLAIPVNEMIPAVEGKMDEALASTSKMFDRPITQLTDMTPKEFATAKTEGLLKDLEEFANWTEQTRKPMSAAELQQTVHSKLYTREGNIGLESRARSALERVGEIPDFLLEKNLYKLADRWALNTFKHLYLRNSLDKLGTEGYKLGQLGAAPESEFVNKIVQDSLGVRKGTAAEGFMQAKIQAGRKLDVLIDKVGEDSAAGKVLSLAKTLPDMLYSATRNIYPNALGYFNIKSALMHSAVSLGRIAPELGGPYGYRTMMRGALKAASDFRGYIAKAEQLGNLPAEFTRKGEAAISDGLKRSGMFRVPGDVLQKMGHAGMMLFQTGEKWNRALVLGTADMMAHDLAGGSRAAQAALTRFPKSVQQAVAQVGRDEQALSQVIGKYLNDTTMFNYNRSSMFEFGRSLGPILSTFSKWPTAIAGEALYDIRSKGLIRGAARGLERLAVPFTMLSAADYLILHKKPGEEVEGDVARKIVGPKGLSGFAPLGALHEFTSGKIFTPPAVDILYNGIVQPILHKDDAKLSHGFDTMLRSYAPGAGLLRFITDDLVTYGTGHRPDGSSFVERTEAGAKKIVK